MAKDFVPKTTGVFKVIRNKKQIAEQCRDVYLDGSDEALAKEGFHGWPEVLSGNRAREEDDWYGTVAKPYACGCKKVGTEGEKPGVWHTKIISYCPHCNGDLTTEVSIKMR